MSAELFDKLYGCYYQVVRRILEAAFKQPLSRREIEEICGIYGYQESALTISPALTGGVWPLLEPAPGNVYRPLLLHPESMKPPLTGLQKSWLKALLGDPRISLFLTDQELEAIHEELRDIEPLYHQKDFLYFDQYRDGDDYASPEYRARFHTILEALEQNKALMICYNGPRSSRMTLEAAPCQLQYSSKDDKFRLLVMKRSHGVFSRSTLLNLARMEDCRLLSSPVPGNINELRFTHILKAADPVVLKISGERNSLERCMLHFANYEKHTEYDEEQKAWICSIYYDLADETELLIEVLSFGPVVRVLGPEPFLAQIRRRVKRQHQLFYDVTD